MYRVALFAATLTFALFSHSHAQAVCDSPAAIQSVEAQIRKIGSNNPDWLTRIGLLVPYFRMKDVVISVVSVRMKGAVRTGTDCEIVLRLSTPPDVTTPNSVQMRFGYVLTPNGQGGYDVDLY
jgi:hypothetical protein